MTTKKPTEVLKVRGKIQRGLGESGNFLGISWVNNQIQEKMCFSPWQGTLNIVLEDGEAQRILKARPAERIVAGEPGFCDAIIFCGMINQKYECGVIIPLVPSYPENILEIVAPVHLKKALKIGDGDMVELELYL
jgi:riboflavin kinase, archaea type